MKSLVALTVLLLLSVGALPSLAQRRAEPKPHGPPGVELGDFLWQGKYYRAAKATVADGFVTVQSVKDGIFRIPVATVPTDLRKKLALPDPPPPPTRADAFPLFAMSEGDLAGHYGAALETGPSALTPASKVAVYNMQGIRLTVHFLDGKSSVVLASRVAGKITPEETEALMARCGTRWVNQGNEVYKSAEGAVAVRLEGTGILTVQSAAFLARKKRP